MKISIESVKALKESMIVEMYKKVINGANKSGDSKRINAAKQVIESRDKLINFLNASGKWKTKNGKYEIPVTDFPIVDAVSIFIQPAGFLTKLKHRFGSRNKGR